MDRMQTLGMESRLDFKFARCEAKVVWFAAGSYPSIDSDSTMLCGHILQKHQFAKKTDLPFSAKAPSFLQEIGKAAELEAHRVRGRGIFRDHAFGHCHSEVVEVPI